MPDHDMSVEKPLDITEIILTAVLTVLLFCLIPPPTDMSFSNAMYVLIFWGVPIAIAIVLFRGIYRYLLEVI